MKRLFCSIVFIFNVLQGAGSIKDVIKECLYEVQLNVVSENLLRPEVVEWKSDDGKTLLHYAAEFGRPCIAALLIAAGADVDSQDTYGNTPLHTACIFFPFYQMFSLTNFFKRDIAAEIWIPFVKSVKHINSNYIYFFTHHMKKELIEDGGDIITLLATRSNWLKANTVGKTFIQYANTFFLKQALVDIFGQVSKQHLKGNTQAEMITYQEKLRDAIIIELRRRRGKNIMSGNKKFI